MKNVNPASSAIPPITLIIITKLPLHMFNVLKHYFGKFIAYSNSMYNVFSNYF